LQYRKLILAYLPQQLEHCLSIWTVTTRTLATTNRLRIRFVTKKWLGLGSVGPCTNFPVIKFDHHAKLGSCVSHVWADKVPKIWGVVALLS